MFDSRKIDDFFDGSKPFENDKTEVHTEVSGWLRFIKLGFPCLAAAIFGLMLVMPNIKKSVDFQNSATAPRKNEMEQLHMEQTVYNATDANNRVNVVHADSVDEVSPGSKIIRMTNPDGEIPTDSGRWYIKSDIGYFNQESNVLTLEKNIRAVDEKGTQVITSKAVYDFNAETGSGREKVYANGEWGKMEAEGFDYDKKTAVLILRGKHKITGGEGVLSAEEKTTFYQDGNKSVSEKNVVITRGEDILQADRIVNYFTSGGRKELKRSEAFGNVRIISPKGTATGDRGIYNQKTGKAELFGKVRIETPKGRASGDKGIYNPQTGKVELEGNVCLEQNGNVIYGSRAITDLNTSVSRVLSGKTSDSRVSGTFYSKRKK